ncbi:MAG: heme-binding protein [Cyanobacteria bacterium SZAS-4]|nr:heme-binding protein [Cyanobacteria bacterium SZAS-4]
MKLETKSILFLTAATVALGTAIFVGSDVLAKYEEPDYEIIEKSQDIELRKYPAVIAAQVELEGTWENSADQAFRILAGYIFGKNIPRQKIAMTVPVTESGASEKIAMTVPVTSAKSDGKMIMRFYMPSKYRLETLPEPIDGRIKFLKVAPASYAVIKFSGFASRENIDRHEAKLKRFVQEKNLTVNGSTVHAFYNPPWTLPFLRRNEVWIPFDHTSVPNES